MNCEEARRSLFPYLDGALDLADRAEVDAHLAGCGPCRSCFEKTDRVDRRLLEAVRSPAPPANLAGDVRARLLVPRAAVPRSRLAFAAAAAIVVLAVCGLAWLASIGPDPEPIAFERFGDAVVAFHRRTDAVPTEEFEFPAGSPQDLERSLSRALGFHACVPDPSAVGSTVRGATTGRLDDLPDRPRLGYVRYEKDGVRIGHIDVPDPGLDLEDAYLEPRGDRRVYVYEEEDVRVVAVPYQAYLCLFVTRGLPREEAIVFTLALLPP